MSMRISGASDEASLISNEASSFKSIYLNVSTSKTFALARGFRCCFTTLSTFVINL